MKSGMGMRKVVVSMGQKRFGQEHQYEECWLLRISLLSMVLDQRVKLNKKPSEHHTCLHLFRPSPMVLAKGGLPHPRSLWASPSMCSSSWGVPSRCRAENATGGLFGSKRLLFSRWP